MRAIELIRSKIGQEIFDYTQLIQVLADYKKPRDVITQLLKKKNIIRVKKGLYVFGSVCKKKEVPKEILANLIFGPSVISLEYALSFYGLIPERVETITSITIGRSKIFDTPLGRYSFTHLGENRYSFGISTQGTNQSKWLISEPLKALADKIWTDKRFKPTSPLSYSTYLFDDLRIDQSILKELYNIDYLVELKNIYNSRKITWFTDYLIRIYN